MSRYTSDPEHQAFVDALRACLGLAPLYNTSKRSAEWWEAGMLAHMARGDGKVKKGTVL